MKPSTKSNVPGVVGQTQFNFLGFLVNNRYTDGLIRNSAENVMRN